MHRSISLRASAGLLTIALCSLLLAACTRGSAAAPSGAPSEVPTAAPTAAPTATPKPVDRTVTEADNGKTITVSAGSTVTLTLASTYWQVQGSSDAKILGPIGSPTVSAPPMGTTCVPGAGCGTVTAVFHAVAAGHASIVASRTSCGEAMMCQGSAGAFEVTIVVGGQPAACSRSACLAQPNLTDSQSGPQTD